MKKDAVVQVKIKSCLTVAYFTYKFQIYMTKKLFWCLFFLSYTTAQNYLFIILCPILTPKPDISKFLKSLASLTLQGDYVFRVQSASSLYLLVLSIVSRNARV